MITTIKRDKEKIKQIFIYTFFWGILSHGMMIFNKISIHDEVSLMFDILPGWSLLLGRWFCTFLINIDRFLFGFGPFSSPSFYGFICFFSITIIIYLLSEFFEIENKIELFLLSGLAISCPTILMLLGYIHFVPFFFPSIIFSLLGCLFICKGKKNIKNIGLGILFISLSIGVYQCYWAFSLALLLTFFMIEVLNNNYTWNEYLKKALFYCCIALSSLFLYLLLNFIVIKIFHIKMADYAGYNNFGITTPLEYLKRIKTAYKFFLFPAEKGLVAIYPYNSRILYWILLLNVIIWSLKTIFILFCNKKAMGIQFLILIAFYPLIINLIFVLAPGGTHALHLFTHIISFAFLFYVVNFEEKEYINNQFKYYKNVIFGTVLFMIIIFSRYDSLCYFKADMAEQQAREWFSTLRTRIESVPEYNDILPLFFINEENKTDNNNGKFIIDKLHFIGPYFSMSTIINDYNWKDHMKVYIGYAPTVVKDESLIPKSLVEEMPSYPDYGSIKIINNIIVVKF